MIIKTTSYLYLLSFTDAGFPAEGYDGACRGHLFWYSRHDKIHTPVRSILSKDKYLIRAFHIFKKLHFLLF